MNKGKVIESGRHVDLMSKENGAYATLMRLQQSLPEPDAVEMRNSNLDTDVTLYMGQDPSRGPARHHVHENGDHDSHLDTASTISMDETLSINTTNVFDTDAGLLGTVCPSIKLPAQAGLILMFELRAAGHKFCQQIVSNFSQAQSGAYLGSYRDKLFLDAADVIRVGLSSVQCCTYCESHLAMFWVKGQKEGLIADFRADSELLSACSPACAIKCNASCRKFCVDLTPETQLPQAWLHSSLTSALRHM